MIPYGRQAIDDADISAVVEVLKSDFLTQGPQVPAFERAVVQYLSKDAPYGKPLYAVAANSATSVLHLACMALEVGPGDRVWTCANSFAASSNCALYCGAEIDFVDIDATTLNMSVSALSEKLARAALATRLPKVVIPVDFAGRPAPLHEIRALADQYGFAIVEDASHAIGSQYLGQKVGTHGLADVTVFSFHPVKIVTTAEGGLAITHNKSLFQRMAMLRTHGITRDPDLMEHDDVGPWYYEQLALGFNYRLTDMQAALGISQLKKIDAFIRARHAVRQTYETQLHELTVLGKLMLPAPDEEGSPSALHLYPVQLLPAAAKTRREVFENLRAAGIGVNVHYLPIYLHPYYRQLGFKPGLCPNAETYYERAISLPMHVRLERGQQEHVIKTLASALA